MIIILFYTIICFALIFAAGQIFKVLIEKLTPFKIECLNSIAVCGFVGISLITGYASLITPINSTFLLSFSLLVIPLYFYLSRHDKSLRICVLIPKITTNRKETIFFTITFLFLSLIASKEIYTFDSGLYHTQSVKWIRSFPVVPGLANFQPQFGFNSMFFPISALFTLEISDFFKGTHLLVYPLNIILFLIISTKIFSTIVNKIKSKKTIDTIFYTLLVSLMFLLFPKHISSLSSDISCALLLIYLFNLVLEINLSKKPDIIYAVVLLSAIIITYKLSAISMAVLCLGLILLQENRISLLYRSAIIGVFAFAPFVLRNYYLSGYLIYPFEGIDIFSPDWKVPIESLSFETGVVRAWARSPGKLASLDMSITQWIGPWWNHQDAINKILISSNTFIIFVLINSIYKRNSKTILASLVVLANFVFWFLTAPDVRFAYGFLFLGLALVFKELLTLINLNRLINKLYFFIVALSICSVLFFCRAALNPNMRDLSSLVIPHTYPTPQVKEISIGFDYFKTINSSRCFNHDIPCNRRLTSKDYDIYLRSTDLSAGFRVSKIGN